MVYTSFPTLRNIFFVGAKKFCCNFVVRGCKNSKFSGELMYWRNLIFINDQSYKLKNSWWQNYLFHVCMQIFFTFTWGFSIWEFSVCSSVHSNSQKSVYYCLIITLRKCEYCLIWALNKSILFGSYSLTVSVSCQMNSEQKFYYSLNEL